ncbi:MAG: hypothetical protein ACKVWR_21770 [Acidimicrobiales bacterium]
MTDSIFTPEEIEGFFAPRVLRDSHEALRRERDEARARITELEARLEVWRPLGDETDDLESDKFWAAEYLHWESLIYRVEYGDSHEVEREKMRAGGKERRVRITELEAEVERLLAARRSRMLGQKS